jgi:uncharacterized damage-inducible protein DinB
VRMKIRSLVSSGSAALLVAMLLVLPAAAQVPPGVGEGWQGEFDHASRQLLQLAEATPAEKFSWRPAPDVRSIAEVYMHIALANHFLLGQAGIKSGLDFAALGKQPEKSKTDKADVIAFLRASFDAVRDGYTKADRANTVQLFKKHVTAGDVFLRILVHNHEHMGQSIAYARMNGVVPPWSRSGGTR